MRDNLILRYVDWYISLTFNYQLVKLKNNNNNNNNNAQILNKIKINKNKKPL